MQDLLESKTPLALLAGVKPKTPTANRANGKEPSVGRSQSGSSARSGRKRTHSPSRNPGIVQEQEQKRYRTPSRDTGTLQDFKEGDARSPSTEFGPEDADPSSDEEYVDPRTGTSVSACAPSGEANGDSTSDGESEGAVANSPALSDQQEMQLEGARALSDLLAADPQAAESSAGAGADHTDSDPGNAGMSAGSDPRNERRSTSQSFQSESQSSVPAVSLV